MKDYKPLPIQKGPVFPLSELEPPKAAEKVVEKFLVRKGNLTLNDGRECPGANKSTYLADSSGKAIELATDGSWTGLAGQQSQTVSRAELSKGQEDTIDDLRDGKFFSNGASVNDSQRSRPGGESN